MACYLDTSLLVPLLIREPGTPRVQAFLSAGAAKALLISPWTITEFSSALALKERVRSISRQALRCQRCAIAGR
jgi:predicted nucleic acid-binding protein